MHKESQKREEMSVITKAELVEKIAESADMAKAEAARAVDAVADCITEALTGGQKVAWSGFGSFEVSERKARKGRNPQTGEEIDIAASKGARFKAGKKLKDAVNNR
jgi:DNA-binding protein HU-beta